MAEPLPDNWGKEIAGIVPTEPQVKCKGMWYISRWISHWKTSEYLHKDGVWRMSTQHQGFYTGYWNTREEAEAFLAQWQEQNL